MEKLRKQVTKEVIAEMMKIFAKEDAATRGKTVAREIISWIVRVNAPVFYLTGQLEWISAAEGTKFARVMKELEELRKQVTKEEIAETKKILAREEKPKVTPVKVARQMVEVG